MIDKAAIFAELTQRNALRRQAQLPLLDVRQKFDHAVRLATWKEAMEQHGDRVRAEVLSELRQRLGNDFDGSRSAGGRWAINALIAKRLHELVSDKVARL